MSKPLSHELVNNYEFRQMWAYGEDRETLIDSFKDDFNMENCNESIDMAVDEACEYLDTQMKEHFLNTVYNR